MNEFLDTSLRRKLNVPRCPEGQHSLALCPSSHSYLLLTRLNSIILSIRFTLVWKQQHYCIWFLNQQWQTKGLINKFCQRQKQVYCGNLLEKSPPCAERITWLHVSPVFISSFSFSSFLFCFLSFLPSLTPSSFLPSIHPFYLLLSFLLVNWRLLVYIDYVPQNKTSNACWISVNLTTNLIKIYLDNSCTFSGKWI